MNTRTPRSYRAIEPLEPRIAPATLDLMISNGGRTAKWTDVDGDHVTLASSKPILDEPDFTFLSQEPDDIGFQLALLDLADDLAQGASLTFSARRDAVAKVGDGFVNVGWIDATFSDLASITVPGDLARLNAGDSNPATAALGSVTVQTAGVFGGITQGDMIDGVAPTVDWIIFGRLGAMKVKGDFGANLNVFGSMNNSAAGSVGSINILGDLFANNPALTDPAVLGDKGAGYIFSAGPIGSVKVAGDVLGGGDLYSGSITTTSSIGTVTIGGSLSGAEGDFSGQVFADVNLGSVTVGANLISGHLRDENGTPALPRFAGSIGAGVSVGKVVIKGNVYGGTSQFGGSIFTPIGSFGKIGSVTIGGSLVGGTQVFGSDMDAVFVFNGIYSDTTIGSVKVGALQGQNPVSPVSIVARGAVNPKNSAAALAIGSVTVARGMANAHILAGYTFSPTNYFFVDRTDVQIGAVKIGNSMVSSSITAAVFQGEDGFFGGNDDAGAASFNPQDNPSIHSRIASVTIGGFVFGTIPAGDSFGIEAEEIGAVKIGGTVLPLTAGAGPSPADDFVLGASHDVRIREL